MQRFFIWFQHRSGSSHLVSLLNSHDEIQCKGEVFGCFPFGNIKDQQDVLGLHSLGDQFYRRVINRFPGRFDDPTDRQCFDELKHFFGIDPGNGWNQQYRGFKYKFPSQTTIFKEITTDLENHVSDLKIIVLHRKDFTRRALSVLNLDRVKAESTKSNVVQDIKLPATEFDVGEVVRLVSYYQSIEQEFSDWPNQFECCLHVEYEELIANQLCVMRQIQKFLGVTVSDKLTSKIKKIAPIKIEELVLNLDELNQALVKNQFAPLK